MSNNGLDILGECSLIMSLVVNAHKPTSLTGQCGKAQRPGRERQTAMKLNPLRKGGGGTLVKLQSVTPQHFPG